MLTLTQLMDRFSNEDACRAHLLKLRWPDGVRCPRCNSEKVYRTKSGGELAWRWICKGKDCPTKSYRFSITSGTIFADTKIPLRTWFQVLYLMLQSKKGMSALQIHRTIGSGSYETAWYMCHRLRAAMQDGHFLRLTGVVEIDETYVGGKVGNRPRHERKRRQRGPFRGKVGVIGAIARKGNVTARVIERMNTATVDKFVKDTVSDVVTLVATDDQPVYGHYNWGPLRKHESVNHERGEYVRGSVHTANLDSFWSLLKRGVVGTFHNVSKTHLPPYLNEFSYRHNHRCDPDIFDNVLESC